MRKIRVLLVEDSLTVRRRLGEALASDRDLELVGEAENGKRAIELCRALRPDVISLDMMLPVMTGLEATEHIMAHQPTPILVVSASVNRGELFTTYDALSAGAVDVLEKPRGNEPPGTWDERFCAALKLVSRIRVISHPRGVLRALHGTGRPPEAARAAAARRAVRIVALGASTGGPGALVAVLSRLPASFDVPIVVLLHIDEPFAASFGEWLETQVQRPVAYPRDGEAVEAFAGRIAMARPGAHLTTSGRRFVFGSGPPVNSCRPSIDVLFASVAADYRGSAVACLLTGMGRDGAAGLLDVRLAGGATVAQDEATSVVYGMPREAAALGAADRVLPLPEIGGFVSSLVLTKEVG